MKNGYFGIWLTLAIVIGVMVMFQVLGGLGVVMFFGLQQENWDPQGVLLINSVAQIIAMAGGAWLITASSRQDPGEIFRLDPRKTRSSFGTYVLLFPAILAAQALGAGLASIWMHVLELSPSLFEKLQKIQDLLDSTTKELALADTPGELVVGLIAIAAVPAMCEELFFRGFALGNIERSGAGARRSGVAIVISSIAFGLSHLSPINAPAIIVLGLVFGWLMVKTNDIRVTMTAHFFNNGIIVLALYALGTEEDISESLLSSEALPLGDSLMIVVGSAIVLGAILHYIGKLADRNSPQLPNEPSST